MKTADLVAALVAAAPMLQWRQTYAAEDFGADFLKRYGWTEFIGQRGTVPSPILACGVLLLAPGLTPIHRMPIRPRSCICRYRAWLNGKWVTRILHRYSPAK